MVLASLAAVLALVAGYARQTVVDSDQFANRATEALRDDSVQSLIAEKITDEVVLKNEADLVAARPLIESVASGIVGGRAFTELFRKAVADLHRSLFKHDKHTVALTIADVGTVLAAALQQVRPDLADEVGSSERVEVVRDDIGSLSATLVDIAERIRLLALVLVILALALVGGALWLSPDRRTTVIELGLGLAAAGAVIVVAYGITRSIAVDHVQGPDQQAAAGAVWDAFLGDLRTEGWLLAGAGAVMAAAASSLIRPLPFGEPVRVAAGWVAREPEATVWRVVRGLAFIAAGVLVLVDRNAVLTLLLTALGIYLLYEGVSMILRLVYREEEHGVARPEPGPQRRVRRRRLAAGLLPAIAVIAVGATFVGTGAATTAPPPDGTCNGHRRAVRPAAERGGPGRDPQLHVGAAAGLVRVDAGGADRRPAPRRHPRPPDRHPLRRQAAEREGAHLLREHGGAEASRERGRGEPRLGRGRAPDPRPARVRGGGRARHVSVPLVLRAGRDAARLGARRTSAPSWWPTPAPCSS